MAKRIALKLPSVLLVLLLLVSLGVVVLPVKAVALAAGVSLDIDPHKIAADGTSTATLSAYVVDESENPVPDGTDVVFSTDHGTVGSSTVTKQTTDGVATATLTSVASDEMVIATVTATANGVHDSEPVFFIPPGGPDITEYGWETISGSGQVSPGFGTATFDATGEHLITAALYSGNPGGTPSFNASGLYFDIHLDNVVGINSLTLQSCFDIDENFDIGENNVALTVYYWDGSTWIPASNQTYADGCITVIITATTFPSLSDLTGLPFTFGIQLVEPPPPPPPPPPPGPRASPTLQRPLNPAQMSLQYLSVTPQQTSSGQPVTISTNVVNTGDEAGNYNITLKINGQVEQSRMVSVGPQGTQPVKFTVTKAQPGTYNVDILGKNGSFTIISTGNAGAPVNSGLIALLIIGVLVLATVVVLLISHRPAQ